MRRLGYICHTELWKRLGVQRLGRQIKEREGRKCNAGDQSGRWESWMTKLCSCLSVQMSLLIKKKNAFVNKNFLCKSRNLHLILIGRGEVKHSPWVLYDSVPFGSK